MQGSVVFLLRIRDKVKGGDMRPWAVLSRRG